MARVGAREKTAVGTSSLIARNELWMISSVIGSVLGFVLVAVMTPPRPARSR
jgi:hypothetical protein